MQTTLQSKPKKRRKSSYYNVPEKNKYPNAHKYGMIGESLARIFCKRFPKIAVFFEMGEDNNWIILHRI